MKKELLLPFILLTQFAFSQIGIGTVNPHSSAILDVESTSRGFLPPRMTNQDMKSISTPTEGLMVFCTDCCSDGALSFWNSQRWIFTRTCPDYDADLDGIPNNIDIDDDNDGIPDAIESEIVNHPSFENPVNTVTTNGYDNFNNVYGTSFWGFLDHGFNNPWGGIFKNSNTNPPTLVNGLNASHGEHYAMYHSNNGGGNLRGEGIYNNLSNNIVNGGTYRFEFDAYRVRLIFSPSNTFELHAKMAIYGIKTGETIPTLNHVTGINKTQIEAQPAGTFYFLGETEVISDDTKWETFSIDFTATESFDRILCVIDEVQGTASSTKAMIAVDNFVCSRDSDGDGLFDHMDKDADNDGCLDGIEAGHASGNYDNYDVGANGLADVLETFPDSGILLATLSTANMFNPAVHTACP